MHSSHTVGGDRSVTESENLQNTQSVQSSPQTGQSSTVERSTESSHRAHNEVNSPLISRELSYDTEASVGAETSSEPSKRFRQLTEIYDVTEEVELDDDELMLMGTIEPTSYNKAATEYSWRQAMKNEIDAVERNNTWELTELPVGKKAIGLKWVFKVKKDANGEVVKHKARIVAKGYVQQQGRDFNEIFAPVTRLETVRLLLALAAKNSWEVHHLDIKSAFLNGELQEEVYVTQPEGFVKEGKEHLVYRLVKALYGLRQAPRAWYAKLSKCLEELNFVRCPYEHAVYTKRIGEELLIIGVYVDDLLVTGTKVSIIEEFKNQMNKQFEMSNLGKLSYYLGIEVQQGKGFIELRQSAYAKKVLEKAGMMGCNPTKYPMDPKELITKDEGGKPVDSTEFKSIVGGLRYLVHTRPDIAYSVGIISRYMEKPTVLHQHAAKRILRYIRGTLGYGLVYIHEEQWQQYAKWIL